MQDTKKIRTCDPKELHQPEQGNVTRSNVHEIPPAARGRRTTNNGSNMDWRGAGDRVRLHRADNSKRPEKLHRIPADEPNTN